MKRTLNWTGRRSIPLEKVLMRVVESGHGTSPYFTAEIGDLKSLGLDPGARVYVEAYVNTSSMRFDFGTVENIAPPNDLKLDELDAGGGILFRVRVVDEANEVGKILASADGIRPQAEIDREDPKALLPVAYRDLGEAIWDMDMQPGARPQLVLNNRIATLGDLIRTDPLIQGAIIPMAVHRVLETVYLDDEYGSDDDEWVRDWKQFAAALHGGEEIDEGADSEELKSTLKGVVARFIAERGWVTRYKKALEEMTGSIAND